MSEGVFVKLKATGKCPICGGELEGGYAIVTALWWDTEKHSWQPGEELLSKHLGVNTNFSALRCSKCHIIIFNYEKKE